MDLYTHTNIYGQNTDLNHLTTCTFSHAIVLHNDNVKHQMQWNQVK